MSLVLPSLISTFQIDFYQNRVTSLHQLTFFIFLAFSLSPLLKGYRFFFFALLTNALANLWFFFVFNWSLSYAFALVLYVLLMRSALLYHNARNSLSFLFVFVVLYVLNSKGDHSFSSYTLYFFDISSLSVVSSLIVPLTYLTPPLLVLPLIYKYPYKNHNHFF